MATITESRRLTPQQRSNRLRDAWCRRMIDLVAVSNQIERDGNRPLIAAKRNVSRFVRDHHGQPDEVIKREHLDDLRGPIIGYMEESWANARDAMAESIAEFPRRWFLVQARALVPHLTMHQRRVVFDTARDRAAVTERDAVTLGLRISISDLIADLLELFAEFAPLRIVGSPMATSWLRRIDAAAGFNIDRTIEALTQSIDLGETLQDASERVAAVIARSEHAIDRIVSTQLQEFAFATEEELLQYTGEAVTSVTYETMLDSRVCIICAPDHGKVYALDDPDRPAVPRHAQCRCAYVPVVDGTPPPDQDDYSAWLSRQNDDTQREILGKTRYALFKAGFPVEGFTNHRGRVLRVTELPDPESYRDRRRRK